MVTMKSWGKTQNQARLGQAENLGWKQLSETHLIYHLRSPKSGLVKKDMLSHFVFHDM